VTAGELQHTTILSALPRIDRSRARDVESGVGKISGALAMTRSGNTNVPCEAFCWLYVRLAGSKVPKMVRYSGDGDNSARGHRSRERERHRIVSLR
jgi:hypothetical protein